MMMISCCRITASSVRGVRLTTTSRIKYNHHAVVPGARSLLSYCNNVSQHAIFGRHHTTNISNDDEHKASTNKNNDNDDDDDDDSYNANRSARPKRIILLRHGQSEGNVDESTYATTPDWKVPLTPLGRAQASQAGKDIVKILQRSDGTEDQQVFIYYSPYKRTRETMLLVQHELGSERVISLREEPRISEQQFGNFQNVEDVKAFKKERHDFGRFYYRLKNGEAGLDVYSRVSSFISTLVRDCDQYNKAGYDLDNTTVVIVLHGLSLRLFLMRWFQFSVEEFELSENPGNGQVIRMDKRSFGNHRWYEINEDDRKRLNLPEHCGIPKKVDILNLNEKTK